MVFQVTVNAMDARYYVDIPSRHVFFIVLSGPLPSR